jgi:effector-binding domain-containing protein
MARAALCGARRPAIRTYLRVDTNSLLEIELATPTDVEPAGNQRIRRGVLPSGRYVTLRHAGPYDGLVTANATLQEWANAQNLTFQIDGSTWRGRIDRYLTDPSRSRMPPGGRPKSRTWSTTTEPVARAHCRPRPCRIASAV